MKGVKTNKGVISYLAQPIRSVIFLYFFLLNVISNLGYSIYLHDAFFISSMITLASLGAYIESWLCLMIKNKKWRLLLATFIILVHSMLILVDYFLLWNFQIPIGQDIVDIIAQTNIIEIENFSATYFSWSSIVCWLLLIVFLNIILLWTAKAIQKIKYVWLLSLSSFIGLLIVLLCIYNIVLFRDGIGVLQCCTYTRLGHSLYVLSQDIRINDDLYDLCKKVVAKSTLQEKPTIVVVIGESFSVYHSSLYGYEMQTNPLLEKRVNDGSLFVFDDAVSVACATHDAMKSIFSLDSLGDGFGIYPLFPACFKSAGYNTEMYDNQYFVGHGINFLSDTNLSSIMFNKRNTERYQYDLDMINNIQVTDFPTLYIIHLWGQHYTYSERYPTKFLYFKPENYDENRWTKEQREVIAHYDNATLYNDFVINDIMRKFEKTNCCVVYFSDHGEEIFETRDFVGHGNAEHSPEMKYQIRVPLMIWTSPYFSRPDVKEKLAESIHLPLMTDDISHLLLDMAGIQVKDFCPSRSFINSQYNVSKPRIVMHSVDYDNNDIHTSL